jgi:hypothetical protein
MRGQRVRVAHREALRVAELVAGGRAGGQIVAVRRRAEREEVVARARRVGLAVTGEERVVVGETMIDLDVVAIDVGAL